MGNSLRCCLACVIPCGALDLIRIVHLNGYVEEITQVITAGEILKSHPNYVLSQPSSDQGMVIRKIVILSPNSHLKRGSIYFLIPISSLPSDSKIKRPSSNHKKKIIKSPKVHDLDNKYLNLDLSTLDNCETHSESKSARHQRRRSSRGKSGIWHPHLQSISEDL